MKKKLIMLLSAIALVCLFCIPVAASAATQDDRKITQITDDLSSHKMAQLTAAQNAQTTRYTINRPNNLIGYTEYGEKVYGLVLPIKISSPGLLSIGMSVSSSSNDYVYGLLCSDQGCSTPYQYDGYGLGVMIKNGDKKAYRDIYISKAGTYYLLIANETSNTSKATFTGDFTYRFTSSSDRTLSANRSVKSCMDKNGVYYKITVPSNGYITLRGTQGNKYTLTTQLYNSSKKAISNTSGYLQSSNGYTSTYKVNKGTYYVKVTAGSFIEYYFKYTFATTISASNNKTFTVTPANSKQNIYVKIKPNKTGYITVTDYNGSAYLTLCNKKQKAVSDQVYMSSSSSSYKTAVFGVKKNETYYLKVNSNYPVKMKYKVTGVSDKSGSKPSKAKAIKKGKTAGGVITAGDSTADYYKVTLSKAQTLSLTMKGKLSSGGYNVEVYSNKKCTKKYRMGSSTYNYYNSKLTLKSTSSNKNKLSKGTYYIKITRKNSKSNGYYSIKWN